MGLDNTMFPSIFAKCFHELTMITKCVTVYIYNNKIVCFIKEQKKKWSKTKKEKDRIKWRDEREMIS